MAYRDYLQVLPVIDVPRCSVATRLTVSDEAVLAVMCHRQDCHAGKHQADIAPAGPDGVTPFGFVSTFEWDVSN
jgi:hypothetical protein